MCLGMLRPRFSVRIMVMALQSPPSSQCPRCHCADKVPDDCPRALINRERVGEGDATLRALGVSRGFDFGSGNYRCYIFHVIGSLVHLAEHRKPDSPQLMKLIVSCMSFLPQRCFVPVL